MDVLKLIPQLYYDLLGRFVPGAVLLIGLRIRFAAQPTPPFSTTMAKLLGLRSESVLLEASAFLLAAYVVGHLLAPLSRQVERIISKRSKDPLEQICDGGPAVLHQVSAFWREKLCKPEYGKLTAQRRDAAIYVCCDWLRLRRPDAGAFATKLRAELRMHGALVAACVLLLPAYISRFWGPEANVGQAWGGVCIIAVAFVLVTARTVRYHRIFRLSVLNFCYVAAAEFLGSRCREETDAT